VNKNRGSRTDIASSTQPFITRVGKDFSRGQQALPRGRGAYLAYWQFGLSIWKKPTGLALNFFMVGLSPSMSGKPWAPARWRAARRSLATHSLGASWWHRSTAGSGRMEGATLGADLAVHPNRFRAVAVNEVEARRRYYRCGDTRIGAGRRTLPHRHVRQENFFGSDSVVAWRLAVPTIGLTMWNPTGTRAPGAGTTSGRT
jgi:hypothetical protein